MLPRLTLLGVLLLAPFASAEEFKVSYFFDNAKEVMHFVDLAFPSAQRGVAVGYVTDEVGTKAARGVAVLTADGGAHWTQLKLDDLPVSLYFLNDSDGWMVTARGIWKTDESGRTWKRISKHTQLSILKVWFLDRNHGFAIGPEKTVLETTDGGIKWTAVKAASQPTGRPEISSYSEIAFVDAKIGLIVGSAVAPNQRSFNPAARQVPTLTLQLQTKDGGVTWTPSTAPLFGVVDGLAFTEGEGLALFTYSNQFEWPSEVYKLDFKNGSSTSVFRKKDRRVTDMQKFPERAFLVAVEPPPRAKNAGSLPGKIHVLSSLDLREWAEIPVDYRATGAFPMLAGPDGQHVWMATDSGMILRMQQ
ncbi:MAG: YCF48-related protein [Acidobacteriota bacterium]